MRGTFPVDRKSELEGVLVVLQVLNHIEYDPVVGLRDRSRVGECERGEYREVGLERIKHDD